MTGNTIFEQVWSKNQFNCQFKLKSGTLTKSNKQNLMAMFTFSVLGQKYPFRENFVQKVKMYQFKQGFGI